MSEVLVRAQEVPQLEILGGAIYLDGWRLDIPSISGYELTSPDGGSPSELVIRIKVQVFPH